MLASVRLAQAFCGYSATAYYAVPLVYSLGLVLAVYALARLLMGVAPSLASAAMVLWLPDFLNSATRILPDIPALFWIVLGLALFIHALQSNEVLPLKRTLAGALCFFLAVSAKESTVVVLLGLVCFPIALWTRRAWRLFLILTAAVVVFELLQMLVLWIKFGTPLYRIEEVTGKHMPTMVAFSRDPTRMPAGIDWAHMALRFLKRTWEDPLYGAARPLGLGYFGWLLASLPVALAASVWRRHRLLLALLGFTICAYATLTLIPVSLDPLVPMVRTKPRYFLVVLVWLPLLALAGWSCLWPHHGPHVMPRWRLWQQGGLAAISVFYAWLAYQSGRRFFDESRDTIANGDIPIAQIGASINRFLRDTGAPAKRIVGPYPVRAGAFLWPELDFKIIGGRASGLVGKRRPRAQDIFVAEHHPAHQLLADVLWQSLNGESRRYHSYYVDHWQSARGPGLYGLVAARRGELQKFGEPVRLRVHLELDSKGSRPTPVRVVLHEPLVGRRRKTRMVNLQALPWKREGDTYSIKAKTIAFSPERLGVISFEFEVKEGAGFALTRRKIELTLARHSVRR